MKKMILASAVAVVMSLGVGCGNEGLNSLKDVAGGGDTTAAPGGGGGAAGMPSVSPGAGPGVEATPRTGTTSQELQATIRLRGENLRGMTSLLLVANELRVFAGDQELAVFDRGLQIMDLTRLDHAWTLGRVMVPEGVESIRVQFTLDDFGGFVDAISAGSVDTRGAMVSFDSSLAQLQGHGHAVVHLNVGESMMRVGQESRMLMPELTVRY